MLTDKEKRRAAELAQGEVYGPSTIEDPDGLDDLWISPPIGEPDDALLPPWAWWTLGGCAAGIVIVVALVAWVALS